MTKLCPTCGSLLLTLVAAQPASPDERPGQKGGSRYPVQRSFCTETPDRPFDLILGRPTRDTITASVLAYQDTEGFVAYGTQPGDYTRQTPTRRFKKGETVELLLNSLRPDTRYYCQFRSRSGDSAAYSFHTPRPPGSSFSFTVIADSHLDENTSPVLYERTLANAATDAPDFHIDLGDTFMSEGYSELHQATAQYLAQRYYFGLLRAPLFLVPGNHDGESGRYLDNTTNNLATWSRMMRTTYFPNPATNGTKSYYGWQWGDALFVVLDPFWFTPRPRGRADNWYRTLGIEQYQWLKRTLETSRTKFTFVFIHHLVGGLDKQGRGGAEAAPFYEWGGNNPDGTDGFKQHRPGWPMPIHQLLVQSHVTIVFHGHDHLYAKQDLDGIVYQEVPQPGDPNGSTRSAAEYGYRKGVLLGSSGHLRVAASARQVTVDYVRTDKSVAYSYVIPADSRQ
jgi:hypothetical protein